MIVTTGFGLLLPSSGFHPKYGGSDLEDCYGYVTKDHDKAGGFLNVTSIERPLGKKKIVL